MISDRAGGEVVPNIFGRRPRDYENKDMQVERFFERNSVAFNNASSNQ